MSEFFNSLISLFLIYSIKISSVTLIVYDICTALTWLRGYDDYHQGNIEIKEQSREFETRILRVIQDYEIPVISLGEETPKEAICQIFENVNQVGVKLTAFELMTASFAADTAVLAALEDGWYLHKDWEKRFAYMKGKSRLLDKVVNTDFLTALILLVNYNKKNGGEGSVAPRKMCYSFLSPNIYNMPIYFAMRS